LLLIQGREVTTVIFTAVDMVDAACTALATGIITKYSTINSGHACDFNYMVYIAGDKVVSEKRECGG